MSQTALTIADLDLMPDDGNRYELIEGELLVSRSAGLTHQGVSGELFLSLGIYLKVNPIGKVFAAVGVVFDDLNGVIPDLVYFSNESRNKIVSGERITGAPDLVVEILSPGSENERRDRLAKKELYGKFGVKEYWILDPALRTIEVFRHDGKTLTPVGVLGAESDLTTPLLPGYSCRIGDLFPT